VGNQWVAFIDEIPGAMEQTFPGETVTDNNHSLIKSIYANLFAGGSGGEYYFGYDFSSTAADPWHGDVDAEDLRSRHETFVILKHATEFFHNNLPFTEMEPADGLSSDSKNYVYSKPGEVYAVFSPRADDFNLDLTGEAGVTFLKRVFNPRTGAFEAGTANVSGGTSVTISLPGSAGGSTDYWIVLLEAI
jgi:hypothetical protein